MPVGVNNKVKDAKTLSIAIVNRLKIKRRKLKIVAVDEGSAAFST